MDILSFSTGSVQRVLNLLRSDYTRENALSAHKEDRLNPAVKEGYVEIYKGVPRIHRVDYYSTRRALGLPDKKSLYVNLDSKDNPGSDSGFEIDLYEPLTSEGQIRFNERILTQDKLILDPPEQLVLLTHNPQKNRGLVAVPSLRDYFVIKTDIVDFSKSGLRPKDQFDILTTIRLSHELRQNFSTLLEGLVEANDDPTSLSRKLKALEALFQDPRRNLGNISPDYPFLPNDEQIKDALTQTKSLLRKTPA